MKIRGGESRNQLWDFTYICAASSFFKKAMYPVCDIVHGHIQSIEKILYHSMNISRFGDFVSDVPSLGILVFRPGIFNVF